MSLDTFLLCLKIASLAIAAWLVYEMWRRDAQSDEPTVLLGRIAVSQKGLIGVLLLSLVVSIAVEIIDHGRKQQKEEQERSLATTTLERTSTAAIQATEAAERAAEATEQATEAVERIEGVFEEVVRISNPIERIELSVSFTLPMDDPTLLTYRTELDKAFRRSPKGLPHKWCTSWNMSMGKVNSESLGAKIRSGQTTQCFRGMAKMLWLGRSV